MLPTAPATTLLWAWRLRRAVDCDDERFLMARAYVLQHGVSPGSFAHALQHLLAMSAAGSADYVLSISGVGNDDCIVSVTGARALLHESPELLRAGTWDRE
jgi:hypothetical protein